MRVATALLIFLIVTSACSKQSAAPASETKMNVEVAVAPLSCRIAVVEEAQLLGSTVRTDSHQSELAHGLDKYAAEPVITYETVASLAEVRAVAQDVATEESLEALKKAELSTIGACKKIDTPEQHAQDALDDAIKLLEAKDYSTMLERYTPPSELAEMKSSGHFDKVVARFEGEWGDFMLQRLKKSRESPPRIKDDESISFHQLGTISTIVGPKQNTGMPPEISLVLIDDHWYFNSRR